MPDLFRHHGRNASSQVTTTELFTESAETWTAGTVSSTTKEQDASDSMRGDDTGKVHSLGGHNSGSYGVTSSATYTNPADTWTSTTALPTAKSGCVACGINAFLYVNGGVDFATSKSDHHRFVPATTVYHSLTGLDKRTTDGIADVPNLTYTSFAGASGGSNASSTNQYGITGGTWTVEAVAICPAFGGQRGWSNNTSGWYHTGNGGSSPAKTTFSFHWSAKTHHTETASVSDHSYSYRGETSLGTYGYLMGNSMAGKSTVVERYGTATQVWSTSGALTNVAGDATGAGFLFLPAPLSITSAVQLTNTTAIGDPGDPGDVKIVYSLIP